MYSFFQVIQVPSEPSSDDELPTVILHELPHKASISIFLALFSISGRPSLIRHNIIDRHQLYTNNWCRSILFCLIRLGPPLFMHYPPKEMLYRWYWGVSRIILHLPINLFYRLYLVKAMYLKNPHILPA